ncbi:hypothetical protein J421_2293 [Gemmatirosa kalamazoonensis]|uniref:Uncharacterized protein n=1 Tax=Gemmatirosa kalamazoonensis TaxID=861299 RepID=W0RHM9_9BACT|nr:hypothetical protein [Gemmatirosa kalamazoonensis]AHG89830.1 hypothetical protein J421_2293 [Gemmatirosa kalamazoonensis]
MTALGLRTNTTCVTYAVVAPGEPPQIRQVAFVRLPAALHVPEQLAFIRTTLLDIIREYGVTSAGVRVTEPMAKRPNVLRANIEGVIQELLGAGAVPSYFAGPLATIASRLRIAAGEIKSYATGERVPDGVADWKTEYDTEQREALLAALAALRVPKPRLTALAADETAIPAELPAPFPTVPSTGSSADRGGAAC